MANISPWFVILINAREQRAHQHRAEHPILQVRQRNTTYINRMEIPVPEALHMIDRKSSTRLGRKKLPKALLTAEIATSLLPRKNPRKYLAADKFTEIEDDAALVLAAHLGSMSLNGLTHLSEASAEALSKFGYSLFLNGLKSLSETSARCLAKHQDKLYLDGIECISEAVAEALNAPRVCLHLNGIKQLSDEVALLLAKHSSCLYVDGLMEFPDAPGHRALAHYLAARHQGTLKLNAIKELPFPILEILVTHQGSLELSGLESLSIEAAKLLAKREKKSTLLLGIKSLDDEVYEELLKQNFSCTSNDALDQPMQIILYGRSCTECFVSPWETFSDSVDLSHALAKLGPMPVLKPLSELPKNFLHLVRSGESKTLDIEQDEEPEDESWIEEENEALNRLANITEQEREMYRAFMGWREESALSFAKIGKQFSMSTSAARWLCERVEQRLLTSKHFPPKIFHSTAPALDERLPRDHKPISKTNDVLFLALMLEGCTQTGWMEISRDTSGHQTYRIIRKPTEAGVKGQQFWKSKTLKKAIFDHEFWEVRRLRRRPDGHRIKIPRGHVLKFPVRREADPLLSSDTWSEHFRSWAGVEDLVVKPGEILCPLCGPMPPLIVPVTSPSETWSMACGRVYNFYCCSGCLGAFDHVLFMMS